MSARDTSRDSSSLVDRAPPGQQSILMPERSPITAESLAAPGASTPQRCCENRLRPPVRQEPIRFTTRSTTRNNNRSRVATPFLRGANRASTWAISFPTSTWIDSDFWMERTWEW